MAEPGLITGYLAALSAQLPASIVAELADGLEQTRQHYLEQGLGPAAAARAATAEFGEPQVIVTAFTHASPARRAARTLLATGPVAGACWATALITSRAWAWPVPVGVRVLLGTALITVIGLLAAAAFGGRYRSADPPPGLGELARPGHLGAARSSGTVMRCRTQAAGPVSSLGWQGSRTSLTGFSCPWS